MEHLILNIKKGSDENDGIYNPSEVKEGGRGEKGGIERDRERGGMVQKVQGEKEGGK